MPSTPELQTETTERYERLFTLSHALNAHLEVDRVLDRALAATIETFQAERVMIAFRQLKATAETVKVNTVHRYMTAPGIDDCTDMPKQDAFALTTQVLETGVQAISTTESTEAVGTCVPLIHQGKAVGALYAQRGASPLGSDERELLEDYARVIAQALGNAAGLSAERERMTQMERLNRVFLTISHNLDLQKVQEMVLQMTMELTKAERAFVLLHESGKLVFAAGRDKDGPLGPGAQEGLSHTACQKVLDTQESVFVFDTGADDDFATRHSMVGRRLKSLMAVPLIGKSGIVGLLYVDSRSEMPAALEQDLFVLTAIASQACILIENAQLLRQATVDGLTGLYIRSYFMNRLEEETRRTLRYGGCFSLLVIDIDHFKHLNDTYGHQTGDVALQGVAHQVVRSLRGGIDLSGRYGGEEFVVLLPSTDATGALVAAERIRRFIEEGVYCALNGEILPVTASIGVATLPDVARSAVDLFARADQALYMAKHAGRNRAVAFEAPVAGVEPA